MGKKVQKKRTAKNSPRFAYSKTILITLGMLLLTLFLFVLELQRIQEPRTRAQTTNCDVPQEELSMNAEETKFLQLLNEYRASKGAPPVKTSEARQRAATWLSVDMNAKKYMNHTDSLGRKNAQRTKDCGYTGDGGGENIAEVGPTAQEAIDIWKKSTEGHNEEMLDPENKVVGIAQVGEYWTLTTGRADDSEGQGPNPSPGVSFYPIAPCPSCATPSNPLVSQTVSPTVPLPTLSDTMQQPFPTMQQPSVSQTPDIGDPGALDKNGQGGLIGVIITFFLLIFKLLLGLVGLGS